MVYFYICDRTDVFNSSKKVMMISCLVYSGKIYLASYRVFTLFSNILYTLVFYR